MDREILSLRAHQAGWQGFRALPAPMAYRLADVIGSRTYHRDTAGVRMLRRNYARVRPELGEAALEALVEEGMRAYMRYWCDLFRSDTWTGADVDRLFRTEGEAQARAAIADAGGGAVLVLGHLGNWDLAGRWSARHLAPVTSVAERVRPEALFARFVAARARMGIRVLPLTGGAPVVPELRRVVRQGGLVALVADRDLSGSGILVDLCGHPARIAPGPAAIARAERAPLIPVLLRRDERDQALGARAYVARFGEAITVPRTADVRADVAAATQAFADLLGDFLRAHTAEWHMLQRVFEEPA